MEFNFFPRTWCLPNEINDLRFTQEQACLKLQKPEQQKFITSTKVEHKPNVPGAKNKPKIGFTMICKPDCMS